MDVVGYALVGVLIMLILGALVLMITYPTTHQEEGKKVGNVIYLIPAFDNYKVQVSPEDTLQIKCKWEVNGTRIIKECYGEYYIYEYGKGQWVSNGTVYTVIDLKSKTYIKKITLYGWHGERIMTLKIKNGTIRIKRIRIFFPRSGVVRSIVDNGEIEFRVKITFRDNITDKNLVRHIIENATRGWCRLLNIITGLPCNVKITNGTDWNIKIIVFNEWGRSEEWGSGGQVIIYYREPHDRGTIYHELGHVLGLWDLYLSPCNYNTTYCYLWNMSTMNSAGVVTWMDLAAAAQNVLNTIKRVNPGLASKINEHLREYGIVNDSILVVIDEKGRVLSPVFLLYWYGKPVPGTFDCIKLLTKMYCNGTA